MTNEQLVAKIQNGENKRENIERLYLQNKGLIAKIASRYKGIEDFDDLFQEGYFGLVTAAELWSPDGGANFSTYAFQWIRSSMQRYIDNYNSTIRVPIHQRERILQYQAIIEDFHLSFDRDPSPLELGVMLKISPEQVRKLKKDALVLNMRSTSEALTEDGEITLEDSIPDERDEIEDLLDDMDRKRLSSLLWSLVDELSEKESSIIKMRYIEGLTLRDIGDRFGITQEGARRHEAKALRKLRKTSVREQLRPYIEERTIARAYQSTGLESFRRTWSSAPEIAVFLKMELEENELISSS